MMIQRRSLGLLLRPPLDLPVLLLNNAARRWCKSGPLSFKNARLNNDLAVNYFLVARKP